MTTILDNILTNIYMQQTYMEEIQNPKTWVVFLCTIILPMFLMFIIKEKYRKPVFSIGTIAFSLYAIYAMTLLDRMDSGASELNFQLFWTWEQAIGMDSALHWYFIIGNTLLFIPLGFSVTVALSADRRRWWIIALIGMIMSIIVEGIQYFGHLGLCELDDVFHNTVGMIAGYVVAKVMLWLRNRIRQRYK